MYVIFLFIFGNFVLMSILFDMNITSPYFFIFFLKGVSICLHVFFHYLTFNLFISLYVSKFHRASIYLGHHIKSNLTVVFKIGVCSVAQLPSTLCDPINCCPSGSSAHGICQARILEWIAIPYSRRSSQSRD